MKLDKKIYSFHIVERESKLSLIRWTYPSVDDEIRELILSKCFSLQSEGCYSIRAKNNWIYIYQWKQDETTSKAVVVTTGDYEPEKYKVLCQVFAQMYNKTGNPVDLVKLYVDLLLKGICSFQDNGTLVSYKWDSFNSSRNLREMINTLGPEVVFLYNAILLKKRVLVYHQNIETLQRDLFSVIGLVIVRNENDYLLPFVDSTKQLKGISFYVAGVTNKDFIQQADLYDVFVDLVTPEITLSPRAKEPLKLTKMHKDLAHFLIEAGKNDISNQAIIAELSSRTKDLLRRLESIVTTSRQNETKMLTMEELRSKNLNPSTENFIFQLAVAENMMML